MDTSRRFRVDFYRGARGKGSGLVMHEHVHAVSAEQALRDLIGAVSTWYVDTAPGGTHATAVDLADNGGRYCALVCEPE